MTYLKDIEVVTIITSPFNSFLWRMTVDYHKFNQGVTVDTTAVPDLVSLIEQINLFPPWYLVCTYSQITFQDNSQEANHNGLISSDQGSNIASLLSLRSKSNSYPILKLVCFDLDSLSI